MRQGNRGLSFVVAEALAAVGHRPFRQGEDPDSILVAVVLGSCNKSESFLACCLRILAQAPSSVSYLCCGY